MSGCPITDANLDYSVKAASAAFLHYTVFLFVINKDHEACYFENPSIFCSSSDFHGLILASIGDSWLQQLLLGCLSNVAFSINIVPSSLTLWNATVIDRIPSSLFISFKLFTSQQTQAFCPVGNDLSGALITFVPQLPQIWLLGIPSCWLLCLCGYFPIILCTSLISGTTRYSRLILYFSCPSLGIGCFSKKPWFLSLESSTRSRRNY